MPGEGSAGGDPPADTPRVYDGLLLDHDGVIVSLGDREALTRAARTALERAGVADPPEEVVETLRVGVDEPELLDVAARLAVDPESLWGHRDDALADAFEVEARAGRKVPYDDADVLADLDLPVGVVSNNQTRVVESLLDRFDLREHVETVHARSPTVESLRRKKPRPTYLEDAMDALDIENPLYVGDSESDVVAGFRAGVDTAYIRRPHRDGSHLGPEPDYEVGDLQAVRRLVADEALERSR